MKYMYTSNRISTQLLCTQHTHLSDVSKIHFLSKKKQRYDNAAVMVLS